MRATKLSLSHIFLMGAIMLCCLLLISVIHEPVNLLLYGSCERKTSAAETTSRDGLDFWWMSSLKGTALSLSLMKPRSLLFPDSTKRIWVDVGVNIKSDFLPDLDQQGNEDLFIVGFEPSVTAFAPCEHERCVVLWAACTPDYDAVSVNVVGTDLCNSLLKPNANTTTDLWRGCVTQQVDDKGRPMQEQVPGLPLHALVSRIPTDIAIEYIKIDAQGFDLEVMKGAFPAIDRIQVVSLEAMDVTDRSMLLYQGQPTLSDIKEVMKQAGWIYVKNVGNDGAAGEVNAFFVSNQQFQSKVGRLAEILMSNKEGRGN